VKPPRQRRLDTDLVSNRGLIIVRHYLHRDSIVRAPPYGLWVKAEDTQAARVRLFLEA
jgi:hypothetical protein